ncbi:hypothetical protein [Amycolatopsis thermoflava]|uniref:hypothetical protein n=1 Tax=Amycolatopsis thermoflava TaxID=84480 RepID=UPI003F4A693F
MRTVTEAAAQLEAALKSVDGLRYVQLGSDVDPPGLVLGVPQLNWEGYGSAPATATFPVIVVVAMDDRALEQLWKLVTPVATAVDTVPDAVVQTADPGVFNAGNQDLPCYTLSVEVSL